MRVPVSISALIFSVSSFFYSFPAEAKTRCVYFIGSGSFFDPVAEKMFLNQMKSIQKRWHSGCSEEVTLFSMGKNTVVYDSEKNTYTPLPADLGVDSAATKKNLLDVLGKEGLADGDEVKLYVGDHGEEAGAVAVDSIVSPEELGAIFTEHQNRGVKVRALFDHCYSGKMLASVLPADGNKSKGCALSITSDRVGYMEDGFVSSVGTMQSIAARNSTYSSDNGYDRDNFHMTSSNRYLLDYYERHPGIAGNLQCGPSGLDELQKTITLPLDALKTQSYEDLYLEIDRMEKSFATCRKNAKANGVDSVKWNFTVSSYFDEEIAILNAARQAFLKDSASHPVSKAAIDDYKLQFFALETCQKTSVAKTALECPHYKDYLAAHARYKNEFEKYVAKNRVKNLVDESGAFMNHRSEYGNRSIRSGMDLLHARAQQVTESEVCNEKFQAFLKNKHALIQMIKTNDLKAINTYRALIACENEEI